MDEFYVEVQDAEGTAYLCDGSYDDLNATRLSAKSGLRAGYVLARVINTTTKEVVDFFEKNHD
jgi:hypothetical protein